MALKNQKVRVFHAFKREGLVIRPNAVSSILDAFIRFDVDSNSNESSNEKLDRLIELVVNLIDKSLLQSSVVSLEDVDRALKEIDQSPDEVVDDWSVQVVNAFQMPRHDYDVEKRSFFQSNRNRTLHGNAQDKADLFRQRLLLVQQRLERNDIFQDSSIPSVSQAGEFYRLTKVESLIGSEGEHRVVLAMLTQPEEGQFALEDADASIKCNISSAKTTSGLFTENCIVLAEGRCQDQVFHVDTLGMPIPEPREKSLQHTIGMDFTGLCPAAHMTKRLTRKEAAEDMMITVLSDVWLDVEGVLDALGEMLKGFVENAMVPSAIVLMGNFISTPLGSSSVDAETYREHFGKLTRLLLRYPLILKQSRIVIVPGPMDPLDISVLPKPPIPIEFTRSMREQIPSVIFASNPCWLRVGMQQAVVFREDLTLKMRRHCLVAPTDDDATDLHHHLVKSIVDQGHLCPLPLTVRPVYWNFDHALKLYPAPDMIILGDRHDSFHTAYEDVSCLNPGSFGLDASFACHYLASRSTEQCQIVSQEMGVVAEQPEEAPSPPYRSARPAAKRKSGKSAGAGKKKKATIGKRLKNKETRRQITGVEEISDEEGEGDTDRAVGMEENITNVEFSSIVREVVRSQREHSDDADTHVASQLSPSKKKDRRSLQDMYGYAENKRQRVSEGRIRSEGKDEEHESDTNKREIPSGDMDDFEHAETQVGEDFEHAETQVGEEMAVSVD